MHVCTALANTQPAIAATATPNTYNKPDWVRRPRFMDVNTYLLSEQALQLELRTAPEFNLYDVQQSAWRSHLRLRVGLGQRLDLLVQAQTLQPALVGVTRLDSETIILSWAPVDWGVPTNPALSVLWERRNQDAPRLGGRLSLAHNLGAHLTLGLNLTFDRALVGLPRTQTYALAAAAGLDGWGGRSWPVAPAIEGGASVTDRAGSRLRADTRHGFVGPSILWRLSDTVSIMGSVFWIRRTTIEEAALLHRQTVQPTLRLIYQPGAKASVPPPVPLVNTL
jgi:hypothetical protein